jgi:hypothetical protein
MLKFLIKRNRLLCTIIFVSSALISCNNGNLNKNSKNNTKTKDNLLVVEPVAEDTFNIKFSPLDGDTNIRHYVVYGLVKNANMACFLATTKAKNRIKYGYNASTLVGKNLNEIYMTFTQKNRFKNNKSCQFRVKLASEGCKYYINDKDEVVESTLPATPGPQSLSIRIKHINDKSEIINQISFEIPINDTEEKPNK